MKIMILGYDSGHNLGTFLSNAAKSLGHEVVYLGYRDFFFSSTSSIFHPLFTPLRLLMSRSIFARNVLARAIFLRRYNEHIVKTASNEKPDLIVALKGEYLLLSAVSELRKKTSAKLVYWHVDEPSYFKSLSSYIGPALDYRFTNGQTDEIMERYRNSGIVDMRHMPLGFDPTLHRKQQPQKDIDISFIGSYSPYRAKLLNEVEKYDIRVQVFGPYWNMHRSSHERHEGVWGSDFTSIVNRSKIAINMHSRQEMSTVSNMRDFEITGSGSFLLTDTNEPNERLFRRNLEVVVFNNGKELAELCKHYLSSGKEREEIALRGHERALREHKYSDRLRSIIDIVYS